MGGAVPGTQGVARLGPALSIRSRVFQGFAASLDISTGAFHGVTTGHKQNHHSEQY